MMIWTCVYNHWCWCQPWSQLAPVCPGRQSHSPVTWWQRYDWPQDGHDMLHWSPYIPARHSGRREIKSKSRRAGAQQQIEDVSDLISSDLSCLSTLTVLTGDSPVAWTTHTRSSFPQARVAVGAMFETGLVTVSAPQALRTRLVTTRTLRGNKGERMNKKWRSGSAHILYQYHNGAILHLHQRKGPAFIEANNIKSKMYSTIQVIIVSNGFL